MIREASLRAVEAFRRHFDEIPKFWKSDPKEYTRVWSVDDDGRVRKVPILNLPGRMMKDAKVMSAAAWCKVYQPAGVVMASESMFPSEGGAEHGGVSQELWAKVHRDLGHFSLADPKIRVTLRSKYNVEINDALMIYGEVHGLPNYSAVWAMRDGRVLDKRTMDVFNHLHSRWRGILTGDLEIVDLGPPENWPTTRSEA